MSIQIYAALICAVLLSQKLGKRPSKRMLEMLAFHQMGMATEEELAQALAEEMRRAAHVRQPRYGLHGTQSRERNRDPNPVSKRAEGRLQESRPPGLRLPANPGGESSQASPLGPIQGAGCLTNRSDTNAARSLHAACRTLLISNSLLPIW